MESVEPEPNDAASGGGLEPQPSESANLEITTSGVRMNAAGPGSVDRLGASVPIFFVYAPLVASPFLFAALAIARVDLLVCLLSVVLCCLAAAVVWQLRRVYAR